MVAGYRVEVNKNERKLEEVYVLVITPIGICQIPITEYIIFFCDTPEEMVEVLTESSKCVKESQKEFEFAV